MITKDNIKKHYSQYERVKTVDVYLDNDKFFTMTRDYGKFDGDCSDHTEFEFDCVGSEDFTEDEKQDVMNLYNNDDLEDMLEW